MMEAVLNLAALAFSVIVGSTTAVLIIRSDGGGCDEGGPGCSCCPFPCEHNRTGEKNSRK